MRGMTTTHSDEKAWRALLAPYAKPDTRKATIQILDTVLPFAGLLWLMWWSLSVSYALTLALAVPTAGFFIRLFILQHDCGHNAFFPSRRASDVLGGILGVITLFPYGYWRKTHALHHATNGNLDEREFGDVSTLTVREYLAKGWLGRLGYRLYRHPFVLLVVGPLYQFVLKHRFPFDIPFSWKREWRSVLWTNVALAVVYTALCLTIGWQALVAIYLPVVMIAGAAGVWLFYVQHQFEDTYWEGKEEWSFYRAAAHGSSYYDLPGWLHWITGNIGFHHLHHLDSRVPNYRLQDAFYDNPELQRATRLTLRTSLACASLRLWDEEKRTMVGWEAVREAKRAGLPTRAVEA